MVKPLVIYHNNCTDGYAAAFAAWKRYKKVGADYLPLDYLKNDVTIEEAKIAIGAPLLDREIYILDFGFPRVVMEWLFENCQRVVWLDHHKSSFENWCGSYTKGDCFEPTPATRYDELGSYILLDDSRSGAWLAWKYFCDPHDKAVPPTVFMLIDDRDRWVFKMKGSREMHAALQALRPWSFYQWSTMTVPDLLDLGTKLIRYQDAQISECSNRAMICRLPTGHTGIAANSTVHFSEVGHALYALSAKRFGMVWSVDADGTVWCNLRSGDDGYDVSEIARAMGGGGHRNAAGFKTTLDKLQEWIR